MKRQFAVLIAALFAAVTFSAVAADTATNPADSAKPAKSAKKHQKKAAKKVEDPAAPTKK